MARLLLLLLAALALVAATCGGKDDGAPPGTGIEGLVTIGPQCPVIQQDTPCPDEPFRAEIAVLDADSGDEVGRFESGEDGTFTHPLMPGTYRIVPRSPNEGAPPFAPEQSVEVRAGAYTRVEIQYDSGIR